MDPYLQSLIEARNHALICLKSSLDNVSHILQVVNSLNSQISASSFVEMSNNNDCTSLVADNNASTSSSVASTTGVIDTDQLTTGTTICSNNTIRRAAILPQKTTSSADSGSSARTTEFQDRPVRERMRYEVTATAVETLPESRVEESRDKPRREPDTSTPVNKDAFTVLDPIKVEPPDDDVVDVDKLAATDSANSTDDGTDDFLDTFGLDERIQMLVDKQRNEDSSAGETSAASRRSTRLQPMVRLEVLDNEELQSCCNKFPSNKGKVGRPRKRRGYDEFLTDEEHEVKLKEKKRQYMRWYRRKKERKRKQAPVRILREEPWPSRIQPKGPATNKRLSRVLSVEIKDERVDNDDKDAGGEKN